MEMLHTVQGLERAEMMRPAYAIEYDCVDPTAPLPTLEVSKVPGLYGAGSSTALRAMRRRRAGLRCGRRNAALKIKGEEPMILEAHGRLYRNAD